MALHGRTLAIRGNIDCVEDVLIEGRVDGHIWNEHHAVTVGADAVVKGDIVARVITVRGEVDGTMMATGRVDLMDEARVSGRVISPRFMLAEGATFNGKVEPQHLDTAMRVARHRHAEAMDPEAKPAAVPAASPAG
jgi:cytoskeletal protein CcmA (bactofilin family)